MQLKYLEKYSDFLTEVGGTGKSPVILLEGKRKIPSEYSEKAMRLGEKLANDIPEAVFRSGNADGSDYFFTEGVRQVNPSALQIFAPYRGHRKKFIISEAEYVYPEQLADEVTEKTIASSILASPKYRGLLKQIGQKNGAGARSRYILRDTLKVLGTSNTGTIETSDHLAPVSFAFFFADLDDINSGGTGHTIRVCDKSGVPYILQDVWENWVV
ncbi:MAG: hypothetical protein KDK38_13740 [Leptospiraceae bacterium]|nr:hypothetical protein [Leptospiraceae bacterium]